MMMETYFDESGTHGSSPVMCVAGYLLTTEDARHLEREWKEALACFGLPYFHAKELAQSGLERSQRDELMLRLVGIIKRRIEIGIAVSVSESDFGNIRPPKWEQGGPYLFAALHVLAGVVSWAEKCSYAGTIGYFFEAGDEHQAETDKAIHRLKDGGSAYLRYKSHTFTDGKGDVYALQAADLLAYEWHRELKRLNTKDPIKRPMRRSFASLLERTHITQHFGAQDLQVSFTQGHAALGSKMLRFDPVE